jgi:hypothetical protein
VRAGRQVEAGETIAAVGRTGLATGPHLHYEVLVRGRSVDPLRTSLSSLVPQGASSDGRLSLQAPPAVAPAEPALPAAEPAAPAGPDARTDAPELAVPATRSGAAPTDTISPSR